MVIAQKELRLRGYNITGIDKRTGEEITDLCIVQVQAFNIHRTGKNAIKEQIIEEYKNIGVAVRKIEAVEPEPICVPLDVINLYNLNKMTSSHDE